MDWNDLRVLLAISRTGTLSAAGQRLGLSHPTVGRRLAALEAATGHKLVQRTADGFVLTDEGAAVLPLAESVEEAALAFERRLSGSEGGLGGTLHVSASDWVATWILPAVVEAFSSSHPDVVVELSTGTRLDSLSRREADVALRVVPFDEADVVQRRLATLRFGVYAAAGSALGAADSGTGSRIVEDARTEASPDVGWLKSRLPGAEVALRCNSRSAQAGMCARGVGLAVLPLTIGDRSPDLRKIDLGEEPPSRTLWIGYHRDFRTVGRLRAFVDAAVACMGEPGSAWFIVRRLGCFAPPRCRRIQDR